MDIDFELKYENSLIGTQRNFVNVFESDLTDIYNSRTFCLFDDIEKLKEGENTFVIRDVATKQLEWSSKILERPTLSIQELNDASRIVDIWKFDNTKHLLSAEQLENTKNPTRKTFAEIGYHPPRTHSNIHR